jgi:hypothetical protein
MSQLSKENYEALFNPNVEIKEQNLKNTDEYNAGAEKGQGGVYKAIIRFIPWWQDPTHGSIQEKWVAWIEDPLTQKGRAVDCPSSVGKPSLLQDMYWKLKKSDNISMQKKADIFSRRHTFASLIQVIKDQQQPELEGKILIYRYGVKIWEKINAELKPLIGEKHDPFDIVNGKIFGLVITKVSGYNNYDQSKFLNEKIPLCIPKDGKLKPIDDKTNRADVFNWVKTNSPDLGKYAFQEWDQETIDYVNHVINSVTGQASTSQNYASVRNDKGKSKPSDSGIISQELNLSDLDVKIPDLNIPELDSQSSIGIEGDLDDVLKNL